jgi:hypothetical protein
VNPSDQILWSTDWGWSLPLIVLTVVIHVLGLGLFNDAVVPALARRVCQRHSTGAFALVMGMTILVAICLHAIEAGIWAVAYWVLGALPAYRLAMLYSLNSLTSYGHVNVFLTPRWQLMGALEALNGIILFGLTTAFLFAMIQRVWPPGSRGWHGAQ